MTLFKNIIPMKYRYKFDNIFFKHSISSVLGDVFIEIYLDSSIYDFKISKNDNFDYITIENDDIVVEIITSDINSKNDIEFGVDYIRVWIIRFLGKKQNKNISIKIDFENIDALPMDSGGGQGYVYKLYSNGKSSLAIGTEDLEFLEMRNKQNDYLSDYTYQQISNSEIKEREIDNSFIYSFKNIDCSMTNQIQFVMSSSSNILDDDYTSDSICQNYKYLLDRIVI